MYSGFSGGRQRIGSVTRVNDPNVAWVNQEPHWELIEALLQGTYGIRKKHRKYLPQEPRELDESYDNRLNRVQHWPLITFVSSGCWRAC